MKTIRELDRVILDVNLPKSKLKKGDIGTVVMVHKNGEGFEVEFMTLDGKTLTVETLKSSQLKEIRRRQIAHARELSA